MVSRRPVPPAQRVLSALCVAGVFTCFACGGGGPSATATTGLLPVNPGEPGWSRGDPSSPVVARVGATQITLAELQRLVDAEPVGADPAAVLALAIDAEVLAQEAARRGFNANPDVLDEGRRAMVRQLLVEGFEPESTQEKIPASTVADAYQRNYWHFNNPDAVGCSHVLFKVKQDAAPEVWEAREREALQVRASFIDPPLRDKADFAERVEALGGTHEDLNFADVGLFPREGRFVEPFAAAAFALQRDGDLSAPVRTRYGWHLIYRYEFKPARSTTFEDVRDEVVQKVWPEWREYRFFKFLEATKAEARIESFPERLSVLTATRKGPVGPTP